MSYKTVEVELENGRVRPAGAEALPEKAHALLTFFSPITTEKDEPSIAELMAESAGIGNGAHTDLSHNKTHLDDFGR